MQPLGCLILAILIGQGLPTAPFENDRAEINNLIDRFSLSMAKGDDSSAFLPPNRTTGTNQSKDEVARKPYTMLEISGFLLERDLTFQDPEHATLTAWVHWKTPQMETEGERTIQFERVAGSWYFRDLEFLKFRWAIIILIWLLGVIYMAAVLAFHYHWRRQKFATRIARGVWGTLIFTPIGWLLYPIYKPWHPKPLLIPEKF